MDTVAKAAGGIVLTVSGVFFFVVLGTLMGAFSGWVVGLFFGDTILGIAGQLGLKGIAMWQFGAFMGFVGGFLKTKVTAEVKSGK